MNPQFTRKYIVNGDSYVYRRLYITTVVLFIDLGKFYRPRLTIRFRTFTWYMKILSYDDVATYTSFQYVLTSNKFYFPYIYASNIISNCSTTYLD
jgi:hypothetical protein